MNPNEVPQLLKKIWSKRITNVPSKKISKRSEDAQPSDFSSQQQNVSIQSQGLIDPVDLEHSECFMQPKKLELSEDLIQPQSLKRAKGLEVLEGRLDQLDDLKDELKSSDEAPEASDDLKDELESSDEEADDQSDHGEKPKKRNKKSTPEALERQKIGADWNHFDPLYKDDFYRDRCLPLLDHARLTMLKVAKVDDLDIPFTLSCYRMFDQSYLPGLYGGKLMPRFDASRANSSRLFAQERRNYADPAYLAPFNVSGLQSIMARKPMKTSYHKKHPIDRNDPNSPYLYGNCLVCESCPCPPCRTSPDKKGWCLLHPTGELLDRVRVSKVILPNGIRNDTLPCDPKTAQHEGPNTCDMAELDIGDTIRQLAKCGIVEEKPYGCAITLLARTACYVTVFRWTAMRMLDDKNVKSSNGAGGCWRFYKLEKIHCIDLRSAESHLPFFLPMDVACHPRYGGDYSDRKFAILSYSKTTRNTIHHVLASDYSSSAPLVEQHNITCLNSISKIDFASANPMTIWAAATSYVRPAFTRGTMQDGPFSGNGHSLYLIDLRADSATFQWSPSAEEFLTEGIHSISGIMTDWEKCNRIWVSSVSAGKTWELDSRMPCKVVSSWSLPGLCDDVGSVLPIQGLHGDGTILVKTSNNDGGFVCPVLSVGKSPGSFGLHVYQPSLSQPRFQTQSLEIAACAIPSRYSASFVSSSMFPLSDVSDQVFTCGLAAFQVSTDEFLAQSAVEKMGCSPHHSKHVLSALTMTSKGDVYLHALLEEGSATSTPRSRIRDGLPIGSSVLRVPTTNQTTRLKDFAGGFNLYVSLSNVHPLTSSATLSQVVKTQADVQTFTSIPLCQPNADAEANQTTDWLPFSHSRVGPQLVVTRRGDESNINSGNLLLPSYEFEDPVSVGHERSLEEPTGQSKSDVTSEVIKASATLWDDA